MNKNKIPTAEEFLMSKVETRSKWVTDIMVEFAKLHVKAALEAAADKAEKKSPRVSYYGIGGTKEIPVVCGDIILNAYPETLIK